MANQPSIVVEGLTKDYGDFRALDGISFKVEPGEIVGFLGPNGAGKTTTMKILTCFMAANSGSAKVVGKDVYQESEAVRRSIGYLPENVPLYEDMLVYDYLMFVAQVRGIEGAKREDAIRRVVKLTGLESVVNRDIYELSKGFRQRVGLAQAIIHEPDVVILDEPTSGLDPNQILEIRDVITEIGREKTVIFSTHILQEVSAVCDRIIVINHGKIVADGTFEELSDQVAESARGLVVEVESDTDMSAKFATLDDVTDVLRDGKTYRVLTRKESDVRKRLVALAAAEGIDLVSLRTYQPDLEETFRALTGGKGSVSSNDEEE